MAESMDRATNPRKTLLTCALLGAVTLAVFWPVFHHDFIVFDDHQYVTENPRVLSGLSLENVKWAFTTGYASNWHPLTWLSHMADAQVFGINPGRHHAVNLLFHLVNSLLLYLALKQMTGIQGRSAFVAALFAVHPLHVESVAWVAERKDVLSTFFFMLTLCAYVRYAAQASTGVISPRLAYVLALIFFALGLMSKPMLVTMPFVLLLLDYWPLARMALPGKQMTGAARITGIVADSWPLIREKAPFFALSAASCVVTFLAQKYGGAVASLEGVPFSARVPNALVAYVSYLQKAFWPQDLSLLYIAPRQWPIWRPALAVCLLLAITAIAIRFRKAQGFLLVGWFWFLGTLVPVIGVVQVGNQFMADRYTYIPLIGLFVVLAWGGTTVLSSAVGVQKLVLPFALLVVAATAVLAHRQVGVWENSERVFRHCLAVDPENSIAHNNLAVALEEEGRFEDARHEFAEAVRINPKYGDALSNMGVLLAKHGQSEEAMRFLEEALRFKPERQVVYGRLGLWFDAGGDSQQAVCYYRQALRLDPAQAEICNNLAWILATSPDPKLRSGDEAVGWAQRACELSAGKQAVYIGTLAAAYAEAGQFQDAISSAEKAIEVANVSGQAALADRNRQLVELYRAGKPYRESRTRGKT